MNVTHWRRSVTISFSCDSSYLIINIFPIFLIVFIPQFRPLCPNLTLIGRWVWVQIKGSNIRKNADYQKLHYACQVSLQAFTFVYILIVSLGHWHQDPNFMLWIINGNECCFCIFQQKTPEYPHLRQHELNSKSTIIVFFVLVHLCVTVYCNLPWQCVWKKTFKETIKCNLEFSLYSLVFHVSRLTHWQTGGH